VKAKGKRQKAKGKRRKEEGKRAFSGFYKMQWSRLDLTGSVRFGQERTFSRFLKQTNS